MKVLAIILAGGKGTRLYPLVEKRCKPAVPFGGKYRIIDFTLSNCINSGIRQINVMVQYLSDSLQKHIRDGWNILSPALDEYIDVYPPQQRHSERWYQGTADAIFQNLFTIERVNPDYILVLAGDHIYKMDYREIINYHIKNHADLTIATIPTPIEESSGFGVIEIDSNNRIIGFEEKPKSPKPIPNNPKMALASMGIYVFSREVLFHHLILDADSSSSHDFGKDIIPKMVSNNPVYSFAHQYPDGKPRYWRDVGTLKSYYDSNMDLLNENCEFELFHENWKFRTCQTQSSPNLVGIEANSSEFLINSIVTGGAYIRGKVKNCIMSPEVIIGKDAEVSNSILFNSCT
ncbi:MAG: sugar phosphate nucleotidyltransferase, partial [Spirochaetota bacterium]|nr:sugar phosphate nucleotidyltransferase [Spirochaetota bacterium]